MHVTLLKQLVARLKANDDHASRECDRRDNLIQIYFARISKKRKILRISFTFYSTLFFNIKQQFQYVRYFSIAQNNTV